MSNKKRFEEVANQIVKVHYQSYSIKDAVVAVLSSMPEFKEPEKWMRRDMVMPEPDEPIYWYNERIDSSITAAIGRKCSHPDSIWIRRIVPALPAPPVAPESELVRDLQVILADTSYPVADKVIARVKAFEAKGAAK